MRKLQRYKISITLFCYRFPLKLFREKSFRMQIFCMKFTLYYFPVKRETRNANFEKLYVSNVNSSSKYCANTKISSCLFLFGIFTFYEPIIIVNFILWVKTAILSCKFIYIDHSYTLKRLFWKCGLGFKCTSFDNIISMIDNHCGTLRQEM